MKRTLPLALALVASGCATLTAADAPGCVGARRPANPHGSVLAPDAAKPTAALSSPGVGACAGARR